MTGKTSPEPSSITFEFPVNPDRINYRKRWGYRAGLVAHSRNVLRSENPFDSRPGPYMPMYASWFEGWDAAEGEGP